MGVLKTLIAQARIVGLQADAIPGILDSLLANLGNLDNSMISGKFPQAKPFENRNFSPEKHFPEKLKLLGEMFLGEKFLGGNVSGGKSFCRIWISRDLSGFQDFWDS